MEVLKKILGIEPTYGPAIPLLGICLEKTLIWKDTWTPMFIAALFTIVKTWRQPKCPMTDEWMKKMYYVHIVGFYAAIKKDEIIPFAATRMHLEIIIKWIK